MAHAWKACWVQALGGSNPPSSATGPRNRFRFRGFCCLWRRVLLLVVPLVFRAPSGPAAREIATREPAARSGRSRSPPVPSGSSGALHTGGACAAGVWSSAFSRSPPWLRRRPPAPRQVPPAPSTPVVPGVLMCGASSRSPASPRRRPPAPQGPRALRLLADLLRVVTNVVNRRCFSCGFLIRCYKRRQSDGSFAENSDFWAQIDDVCNRSPRKALHIPPV